jgi:hypothetical protein
MLVWLVLKDVKLVLLTVKDLVPFVSNPPKPLQIVNVLLVNLGTNLPVLVVPPLPQNLPALPQLLPLPLLTFLNLPLLS